MWRLRTYVGRRANGTPIQQRKTVYGTIKDANRELAKLVAKHDAGQRDGAKTVGALVDEWLSHIEGLGRSPTTLKKYRQIIESTVRPKLGHLKLSKLTPRELDRLYSQMTARGNKATTVRRVHALIAAALHQAERWGYVETNVSGRATPPPVLPARVKAPSRQEVQALLSEVEKTDPTLARMLLLDALTGLRRGELAALRWTDVDFETEQLNVARSVYELSVGVWGEKPTHQDRTISLDALSLATLRLQHDFVHKLAAELGEEVLLDGFIFSKSPVGAEPYRLDTLTKTTRAAATAAGVDIHLHTLRHFHVTQGFALGYDPVTIGARVGHRDPSVTLRVYGHATEQKDRELAASVGETLALPKG